MATRFGVHCIKSDGRAFSLDFDSEDEALAYIETTQEIAPELKLSVVDRKTGDLTFFERKVEAAT